VVTVRHNSVLGPLAVFGFLVALGASGERGQRVLDRLRCVARRVLLGTLVLTPIALIMPPPCGTLCFAAGLSIGAGSLPIWCYATFARWLTREE
jgi:hypothetical protein